MQHPPATEAKSPMMKQMIRWTEIQIRAPGQLSFYRFIVKRLRPLFVGGAIQIAFDWLIDWLIELIWASQRLETELIGSRIWQVKGCLARILRHYTSEKRCLKTLPEYRKPWCRCRVWWHTVPEVGARNWKILFSDCGEVKRRYSKPVQKADRSLCRADTSVTRLKYERKISWYVTSEKISPFSFCIVSLITSRNVALPTYDTVLYCRLHYGT